jgi:hypothetical protein
MHIRIVLSAKIGKDYQVRELGAQLMDDGIFRIDFPRDMDWTAPFNMICEPDVVKTAYDKLLADKIDIEAKRPVKQWDRVDESEMD